MGEWSEWSSCKTGRRACDDVSRRSFRLTDDLKRQDNGEAVSTNTSLFLFTSLWFVAVQFRHERMMSVKNEAWTDRLACMEEGTCPDLQQKLPQNFTECIDGKQK